MHTIFLQVYFYITLPLNDAVLKVLLNANDAKSTNKRKFYFVIIQYIINFLMCLFAYICVFCVICVLFTTSILNKLCWNN